MDYGSLAVTNAILVSYFSAAREQLSTLMGGGRKQLSAGNRFIFK